MSKDATGDLPRVDYIYSIYIDGNHSYSYVKKDIENYSKKILPRGILSGHDFDYRSPGVIKAVTEFCNKNKFKLNTFGSDWWIIKKKLES